MSWFVTQGLGALQQVFNANRDETPRIQQANWWRDGNDAVVRFEPSRSVTKVVVHVQRTGTGGAVYDAATSVSRTEYDARSTRLRDVTFTMDGANNYYVWVIPMTENPRGTWIACDGVSAADGMWVLDLGT
jgi:hypothetical protein